MIFKIKRHNTDLYITLLNLSRNIFFYKNLLLKDTFETRVYLMFFHFSIILNIFKKRKIKFSQNNYDNLFFSIENDLRELGFGDVSVNKKMKELNKILYDILLKIGNLDKDSKINKNIVFKYFNELKNENDSNFLEFERYFVKFHHFCFDIDPKIMIKEALNFKG